MNTLIRYGLIIIGLIIALIIVAAISIPLFFDPNDYKEQIVEQVETRTGRSFQLNGDLKLSVFPWLGVEIGGLTLGNAKEFGDQPMLKTGLVQARVKLLPLLKKEVEMNTVVLRDAHVLLMRDKSGKTNWDDLLALDEDLQDSQDSGNEKQEDTGSEGLASLALGGIQMENANLVWDDQSTQKHYEIKDMNLKTGKLEINQPVDLDVAFDFDARAENLLGGLAMESTIEYDLEKKKYRLAPFKFSADLEGKSLPGGVVDIRMTAKEMNADLIAATASLKNLSLKAKGAKIEGDIQARNIFDPVPLADGNIRIQVTGLPEVLAALGKDPSSVPVKSLFADTTFSSGKETITFQKLTAKVVLEGGKIVKPMDVKLNAAGTYNTAGKDLDLKQFRLEGPGATAQGSLSAKNIAASIPLVNGNLNIAAENVHQLMTALGLDTANIPLTKLSADARIKSTADVVSIEPLTAKATLEGNQIPSGAADVNLNTNADVNIAGETLNLSSLSIQGMGLDVKGSVRGSEILKNPNLAGQIDIAPFNLRQLMKALKMEVPVTADSKVLTSATLSSDFSAGNNSLKLDKIRLQMDDTNVKGNLSIANFDDPATAFDLAIDSINADRYLPPLKKGEKAKPATPGTAAATAAAQLPMDTLRKLKINGKMNIGKLIITRAKLNHVQLGLNAKAGKINLTPAKAQLYNGSYSGSARLDATGSQPAIYLTSAIKNMNTGPLLEDLQIQSNIQGTMNSDLTINAAGTDTEAIKKSLNGNAKFTFTDGTLKGVNLGRLVREVDAAINRKKLPPDTEPLETDFSEMSGNFTIAKGLISNRDLIMKSPLFRVEGKGTAHLVTEKIDYSVKASVVRSSKGQGGEELNKLEGIPIPIKVTGTFSKPQYFPDIEEVAKILAEKELKKRLEKVLPKELKGLSGLLGVKPKDKEQAPATQQPADKEKAKPEDVLKQQLKNLLKF